MQNVWMLSPFSTDTDGNPYPNCSAYCTTYMYPWLPAAAGAPVAITEQSSSSAAYNSPSVSITNAIPAGVMVMLTVMGSGAPFAITVADNVNNTYVALPQSGTVSTGGGNGGSFWQNFYCITPVAIASFTITGAGGNIVWVSINGYSGVDPLNPLVYSSGAMSSTGLSLTMPIPTTTAGELTFVVCGAATADAAAIVMVTPAGFTDWGGYTNTISTYEKDTIKRYDNLAAGITSVVVSGS